MSGNVREWVEDTWYADYGNAPGNGSARVSEFEELRVVRGGSYTDASAKLRSTAREPLDHGYSDAVTGFRIVREIAQ